MKEFISTLQWVDYIAFAAVVWGLYIGYRSGFFPELLRIVSYFVTVIVTFRYYDWLAQWLSLKTFLNVETASTISFFSILLGTFILTKLLIMLLLRVLKIGEGGYLLRVVGAAIGACRFIVLLSLLIMLIDMSFLAQLKADIHTRSLTGAKIAKVAPTAFDFLSHLSPQLTVPRKSVPKKTK